METTRNTFGDRVFTTPNGKVYNVSKVESGADRGDWRVNQGSGEDETGEWVNDFGTLRDAKAWLRAN